MEPSGKSRIVVSAMLFSLLEPWYCPAQAPAPATSPPISAATPSPVSENRAAWRKPDTNELIDIRQPTDFAAFFRLPGESAVTTPSRPGSRATDAVRVVSQQTSIPDPAMPRTTIPPTAPLRPAGPGHADTGGSPGHVFGAGPARRETPGSPVDAYRHWPADQPRDRIATVRRPALDRGRGPGQRLGRRGTAHAGQGPVGPCPQRRCRLHPA